MSKSTETNRENHAHSSQDALTELLRTGAQRLIAQAIEAEVEWTEHRARVGDR